MDREKRKYRHRKAQNFKPVDIEKHETLNLSTCPCRPVHADIEKHESQEDERKSANVEIEKRKTFIYLSTQTSAKPVGKLFSDKNPLRGLSPCTKTLSMVVDNGVTR